MARKKSSKSRSTTSATSRKRGPAHAERSRGTSASDTTPFADLHACYRLGQDILTELGSSANKNERSLLVKQRASMYQKKLEDVTQAVQFANTCDETELDELTALRDPDGNELPVDRLDWLLAIPDRARRRTFAKEAAKNGWTWTQMKEEYSVRIGAKGNRTGRPPKHPETTSKAILRVITMSTTWLNWYARTEESIWPKALRRELDTIAVELGKVRASSERALDRIREKA